MKNHTQHIQTQKQINDIERPNEQSGYVNIFFLFFKISKIFRCADICFFSLSLVQLLVQLKIAIKYESKVMSL